jgi:hypothetical protein
VAGGVEAARPAGPGVLPALDLRLLAALTGAKLLVHLPVAGRYGYFRDELYFLDCARHLDWGYVDHAPLVAVYAKIALLLGGSLPALRLLAALAGAGVVALAMLLAREMGGGRFAQGLAGLAVLAAPINLGADSILSMNAFEPLFWMGCVLILIRLIRTGNGPLWIGFGTLAGLGLENKHSTLLFGFALAVALVASPERREILRPWIWAGAGIALAVFLPNLIWQARHGYPTLEDLRNVRASGKNVVLGPFEFIAQQILLLHPFLCPIWLAGLASLLFGRARRLRVLGTTYVVLLVTMFALGAKNYYLAPIYPMLFAAGAVSVEDWLARRAFARGRVWPRAALLTLVAASGALVAPAILPYLQPERLLAYQRALGAAPPKTEVAHEGPLEQRLGDQFGWEELVADVARLYRSLPAEERARTGIFASNYGEAGALNLFGPAQGLPAPICAHQTHFLWGPGGFDGENLIWLQWGPQSIGRYCRSAERIGEHFHPWGMAEENRPIYLCRGLRAPLREIWPDLKHWN